METLFKYSLSVSIPLLILWITYHLSIARVNRFGINRLVIMLIYSVSLGMTPILVYFKTSTLHIAANEQSMARMTDVASSINWVNIFSNIWGFGIIICCIATIVELLRILFIKRNCKLILYNNQSVYISDDPSLSPFTFGRMIVMNRNDFQEKADVIILHETGHRIHRHFYDLVISRIITILCWYNPASWLMQRDLKELHEYQADRYVLDQGYNLKTYQLFLIARASGSKFTYLASNLNYSQIKKRISTMNRKTGKGMTLKYALPMLGLILALALSSLSPVRGFLTPESSSSTSGNNSSLGNILIFVNGKEISHHDLQNIPKQDIKSITVLKSANRIDIEMKQNNNQEK